nr:MAG TPA: hypothetical protein [Caudoviricetes sp.]
MNSLLQLILQINRRGIFPFYFFIVLLKNYILFLYEGDKDIS